MGSEGSPAEGEKAGEGKQASKRVLGQVLTSAWSRGSYTSDILLFLGQ